MKINPPYLIQRLKRPYKEENNMTKLSDAFSFGGGLVNGGLSKEAYDIIKKIWRYDYMGSAEFEFGSVPKSLEKMVELRKTEQLVKFDIPVKAKAYSYQDIKTKTIEKDATVYVVCKAENKDQIIEFITKLADKTERRWHTKESVFLADSICDCTHQKDIVGWHEIDNHYMFFTDKEMFDKFCELFEL